jgi:DNA-binding transcriptional MerR regulator
MEDVPGTLTLEQLSERSGVSPRTIRYYQSERLLDPPERHPDDARVGRYGPAHLERLRLIGELRDRGLKLPAIRNLLRSGDATTRVADWLGLDETLRGSWGHDAARVMGRAELAELAAAAPPGTLAVLEETNLLSRQGDGWLVPSPQLLELAIALAARGVGIDMVLAAGRILSGHLGAAAAELVELFVAAGREARSLPADTHALVDALRPAAGDAASILFARALEQEIAALLEDTARLEDAAGLGDGDAQAGTAKPSPAT